MISSLVFGEALFRQTRHLSLRCRINVVCSCLLFFVSICVSCCGCSHAANVPHKRSIYFEEGDHVIPDSVSASASGHHDGHHDHVTQFRMSPAAMLESVLKAPPHSAATAAAAYSTSGNKSHVLRYGDSCRRIRCHIGHVCAVVHRKPRCVCGQQRDCLHHTRKPVCGSDGHLYASHCELHRVACARNVRIRIQHPDSTCVAEEDDDDEAIEAKDEVTTSGTAVPTVPSDVPTVPSDVPTIPSDVPFPRSVSRVDISEGSSLELRCDIRRISGEIKWTRHGHLISGVVNNELEILANGALYFREVTVLHAGIYSCRDSGSSQDHILTVHTPPIVSVYPMTQFHTPGEIVRLQCSADGIPKPKVHWEVNESPLPNEPRHWQLQNENHTLTIVSSENIVDTGAYKCKAKNSAGVAQDIATVFVEKVDVPKYINDPYEVFVVFHDLGYAVYNPRACIVQLEVEGHRIVTRSSNAHSSSSSFSSSSSSSSFSSSSSSYSSSSSSSSSSSDQVPSLCRPGDRCSWGDAVNVRNRFLYVSQPNLNRIIVIEINKAFKPIETIATDRRPMQINYIDHLDQIWIVCWSQDDPDSEANRIKTNMIIRDASEDGYHHTIHTQPVNNRFDAISDIFLPRKTALHHDILRYGYVSRHIDKQRLYKLDLETLRYVSEIDLRPQHCVPSAVAFIPLGGRLVIDCGGLYYRSSPSLLLDYVTDAILASTSSLNNVTSNSFVSPDGRLLVTTHRNRPTLSVYHISDNGKLEHGFDVETSQNIANVGFFPTKGTEGRRYDVFGRLHNSDALLYVNITNGKTERIQGTGYMTSIRDSHNYRDIVTSGAFGNYLMMRSAKFLTVVDGERRTVHCQCNNTRHASVMVWVEPLRL